jgi:hypothetical protein
LPFLSSCVPSPSLLVPQASLNAAPDLPQDSLVVSSGPPLRVEVGIKLFDRPRQAFVFGSASMEWLLSFSHGDWKTIFVATPPLMSELDTKIFRRMGAKVSSPSSWLSDSNRSDVLLGAGHGPHLADSLALLSGTTPALLVTMDKTAAGQKLRKFTSWPIHHCLVGGTTTSSGRLWIRGWVFDGLPQRVSRSLGHILDHGALPSPCSKAPTFDHLSPSDLLPQDCANLSPIVFPTHASRTKWGSRELSAKELSLCYDAPQWLVSNPGLLKLFLERLVEGTLVPLKLLQASLHACLLAIDPPVLDDKVSSVVSQAVPIVEDPRGTWLPALQRWMPSSWVDAAVVTAKAAKGDDAEVHVALWNSRITSVVPCSDKTLDVLRKYLFGRWCGNVGSSLRRYLTRTHGATWSSQLTTSRIRAASLRQHQGGLEKNEKNENGKRHFGPPEVSSGQSGLVRDAEAGKIALHQVLASGWWDWTNGSSLLFWRWDFDTQRSAARDGMEIFVQGELPTNLRPARPVHPDKRAILGPKIDTVRKRNYIAPGPVSNLTDFFDVPKGEIDFRIVYNGTTSGLNEKLWSPGFFLPNADSAGRLLMYNSYTVDADLGEMFLNFPMDPRIRPYAGVDLTSLRANLDKVPAKGRILERWERLFMGMKPSPYNSVRYFYWAEEFARGNPLGESNALRYDRVILNLPGMELFDPSMPSVMKWNDLVDRLAGDILTFVDDLRAAGYDRENGWQVARQIAARLQFLGIQDAARKRRPSTQDGGAWAGTIFLILVDAIYKTVSQEKWDKGRGIVLELAKLCLDRDQPPDLCHKDLERKRGFLIHLAMTFTNIIPFLKGLHLTIDSWRDLCEMMTGGSSPTKKFGPGWNTRRKKKVCQKKISTTL